MSPLALAALAFAIGVVSLLSGRRPAAPWLVGLGGLALVLIASWSLPVGLHAAVGGEPIVATGYLRLLLILLAIAGGALTVVAWAASLSRTVPGLMLISFSSAAAALALVDPLPAVLVLTIGSLATVLASSPGAAAGSASIIQRALRPILFSGLLLISAMALVNLAGLGLRPDPPGNGGGAVAEPGLLGLALLAVAAALAVRGGAVPVHGWLGRLSEALSPPAIAVICAWGPATLAIVALGWLGDSVLPLEPPLGLERFIIAIVAIASVVLGAVAATLHDDLEHVVGYSLVSDAGILLLAVASPVTEAWAPARAWILMCVLAKSALAGWATAMRLCYGTQRIPALSGWARRSPLLGAALVLIGVAVVGIPGLPSFESRSRLIGLALEPPFDLLARFGVLASAAYFVRLLVTGLRRPSGEVARAVALRPAWPRGRGAKDSRELVRQVPATLRLNRRPVATLTILGMAILSLSVAGGAFRGPSLAAEPGPRASATPGVGGPVATPSAAPLAAPASAVPSTQPSAAPSSAAPSSAAPSPGTTSDRSGARGRGRAI